MEYKIGDKLKSKTSNLVATIIKYDDKKHWFTIHRQENGKEDEMNSLTKTHLETNFEKITKY